jgi:hypothetical protein
MFEALIAVAKEDGAPDMTQGSFKIGGRKRNEVFRACAEEIRLSYADAVDKKGKLTIKKLLEGPINNLRAKKRMFLVQDCGTVARWIIGTWASWVRIVHLDTSQEARQLGMAEGSTYTHSLSSPSGALWSGGSGQTARPGGVSGSEPVADGQRSRKMIHLKTLQDLPDVELWR